MSQCCVSKCRFRVTQRANDVPYYMFHYKHCCYPQCTGSVVSHDNQGSWCNNHKDGCKSEICPSQYLSEWKQNPLSRAPTGSVCTMCQTYKPGNRALVTKNGEVKWVKHDDVKHGYENRSVTMELHTVDGNTKTVTTVPVQHFDLQN